MESVTWVQILEEAACISLCTNIIRKGMNMSVLTNFGKIVGTVFFFWLWWVLEKDILMKLILENENCELKLCLKIDLMSALCFFWLWLVLEKDILMKLILENENCEFKLCLKIDLMSALCFFWLWLVLEKDILMKLILENENCEFKLCLKSDLMWHLTSAKWCPHGEIVKVMDCGIVVSKYELQLRYYIHFRTNTLGKDMTLLILPAMV